MLETAKCADTNAVKCAHRKCAPVNVRKPETQPAAERNGSSAIDHLLLPQLLQKVPGTSSHALETPETTQNLIWKLLGGFLGARQSKNKSSRETGPRGYP